MHFDLGANVPRFACNKRKSRSAPDVSHLLVLQCRYLHETNDI